MKRKNINLASLVISLFTACGSNEKNKEIVSIEPGTTEVTTTDPRINERQTKNPDFNTELERYGFKEIFYDPERPETAEFQEAFDSYTIGDLINADNTTYIILNGSLNRTDSTSEDSKVPIIYFKPRIDNTYLFVEAFAR